MRLKSYQEGANQTHGFFTTLSPEDILSNLTKKMADEGQEFSVSDKVWRINFTVQRKADSGEDGSDREESSEDEEEKVQEKLGVVEAAEIQVEFQKVSDNDLLFVNFKRKAGAALLFYENAKVYME